MKHNRNCLILGVILRYLVVLLLALCCFSANLFATTTPVLRFSVGEKHPMIPLAEQVLQTAYHRIGYNIEIIELPGGRANSEARYGTLDGELFRGIYLEDLATNVIRIPVSIATGKMMAFSTNKNIQINGWQSLKNYRLGGLIRLKGTVPDDPSLNITYIKNPELLFKMLERGRIEVAIAPVRIGAYFMAKMNLENVVMLTPPIREDNLYHYLSQKHADMVLPLTNMLKQMKDSGELEFFNQQAEVSMAAEIKIMDLQSTSSK